MNSSRTISNIQSKRQSKLEDQENVEIDVNQSQFLLS